MMMAHQVSFFSLALLLTCSLNQAASEVYHITANSTSTDPCTAPCLTLSEFTTNLRHYLHYNTILLTFLPGTHYFTVNLSISNNNFSMISENKSAQLVCRNYSHIHFYYSQYISISNLEFIGCGGNKVEHVKEFVVKHTKFKGQNNSGTALEIIKTTAQIVNSTFELNRKGNREPFIAMGKRFSIYTNGFVGGAIIATGCMIIISQSTFENNGAQSGGAIFAQQLSTIIIHNSIFTTNSAFCGGVLFSLGSIIIIKASEFGNNTAKDDGGVLYSFGSIFMIKVSNFDNNMSTEGGGGVLYSVGGPATFATEISIINDTFHFIKVRGKLHLHYYNTITIEANEFSSNSASNGGVLYSKYCTIIIVASKFYNSSATSRGGVVYSEGSNITIDPASECNVNTAISEGGVLFSQDSTITVTIETESTAARYVYSNLGVVVCTKDTCIINPSGSLQILNNTATYAVIYLSDSELNVKCSGSLLVSNNVGSLVAFNSNITFMGHVEFVSNHPEQSSTILQEGGAITLIQSNAFFNGNCSLQHNHAENGGALLSSESKFYVNGNVTIAHNTATRNGGGVYLFNSELICLRKSTFLLHNNHAGHKGGGLHASSSFIKAIAAYSKSNYIGARLNFTENVAKMGGGLSLEANAKLYILKYDYVKLSDVYTINTTVFTDNSAHSYGGAVYVDDDTNSGTCASSSNTECFFQVLAVHGQDSQHDLRAQSIYFSQNQANTSGSTLYGGLLDRCTVSQFSEVHNYVFNDVDDGLAYFKTISVPTYEIGDREEVFIASNISISSGPVKMCLCIKNEHNCSHQARIEVKKGEAFNVSLVAVDQIEQPVTAIIHASLKFPQSGLAEGQLTTEIQGECTDLTFNVVSPHNYENLTIYALDGPCKDAQLSTRIIEINFLPCSCPIGFQVSGKVEINCTCDCHSDISQYTEHCNSHTGSFVKKSQSRAWISYINDTNQTGYLVYQNCPFDYCNSLSLPIDLNQPNGADKQCAFNRSSLLCGTCQPGLSLSLGSSRCLPCPSYWPVQLIAITLAAILAGVALVAILLLLNMTVAIGSINGLIFYANVVHANKSILLPFQETNIITVFISLLNLELGVDTCYFQGMDAYVKTWLQLAFPAYVILLVGLVIIVSSCSLRFSKLIGKKDPVATLATLILLSYAKVLEICFESFSVGILKYPDGTSEPLWLPDATVKYLSGKHIPLFVAAVLILMVGLIYTALLFLWQWLLLLPDWKIFKWTRDQKLQTFVETHHAPFTPKYRYWTGLLLIARAILYLIAAVNVSNDPQLALSAIIVTVSCIFLFRSFIQGSKVYKRSPVNILEIFFFLNLLFFSTLTWYSLSNTYINQETVAYISVLTAFFVLLLIILYHAYTYTTVFSIIKKTRPFRMTHTLLTRNDQEAASHQSVPPDDDIHRFNELLDLIDRPVNTDDYRVPLLGQKPPEPTQSVVEVRQPYLPPPEPEQVNTQNIPGAAKAVQVNAGQRENIRETERKESKV